MLGFSPADRHMLYVLALSTGLRASELASLKPESLLLLEDPPTVTVKAGYSKRRRMDVLPLPSEILQAVRAWLAGKPAGQPLWPGKWAKQRYAGKILQCDLLVAKVDYVDANGLFADFHALRHTYITNLGRHGVPLVAAQKLARHSTPVLTAARYTHIDLADQSREVQKLPRLLGTLMGQTNCISCPNTSPDGNEKSAEPPGKNPGKQRRTSKKRNGEGEIRTPEPLRAAGFQDRCNRPLCHLSKDIRDTDYAKIGHVLKGLGCTPAVSTFAQLKAPPFPTDPVSSPRSDRARSTSPFLASPKIFESGHLVRAYSLTARHRMAATWPIGSNEPTDQ